MATQQSELHKQQLLDRIAQRTARVGVIGLGYVGLPLAVLFASSGYRVTGIDTDPKKVDAIRRGECYIDDVDGELMAQLVEAGSLTGVTEYEVLSTLDAVSICVPTPLNKTGDPDVSHIVDAAEAIARHLHPGMVVVLESTTYPGTTRDLILPTLVDNGPQLGVGEDFFLAFSPERVDPGRGDWTIANTPRVLGGVTPECLEVASALYEGAVERVVPVSSPEAAETVKLLENTFRAVNIALVNEVLLMCDKLGLDAWEVIEAAATKPFGFMKFTPGPGLGGHCIPIDPLYLGWKMKTLKYTARFIALATEINASMPAYWVGKVQDALNESGQAVQGSRVLILGAAYKKNVDDLRESPALDIIHLLEQKGAEVSYHDPYVPVLSYGGSASASVANLDEAVREADCVVVVTDHDVYDWPLLHQQAKLWVDTRHAVGQASGEENESRGSV
jgi:UDP-N-acetyl-D-glucosamine dehydrogenase